MLSRVVFLLLICELTLSTQAAGRRETGSDPKRVLIVNSFGTTAPPFSFQATVFKSELVAKMGQPVDLDEVSLDMARYDVDMQQAIVDYLEKRQAKWRSDLVVAIGAPATTFVASHRDQLFRETPILYAAGDRRLLPPAALENNAAYVGQSLDIPGLFEDMLQVAPATRNIEIVVGATPLELLWQEAFKKATEPLSGRIKFTYYSDLSFEQMLQRAATLPPDSYILFLLLLRDKHGVTVNADEALQRLHQVARAPINSLFAHQLGTGIVGGRLLQSDRLGKVAADFAVRILHGEPASNLPPKIIERLSPHYDWRELQRWKIDEKLLPPGSTILYRTPGLWQEHRGLIIAVISICALEGLLIALLVFNRIWRRRAEHSLTESEDRVALAADAGQLGVWEVNTATSKVWVSDKLRELFQIAPGTEVDYETFQNRVHPEDQRLRSAAIKRAIDTKGGYEIEYRILLPDGTVRWINGRARTSNGNGKATLRGVAMDVTKRKQAEELFKLATEAAPNGTVLVDGTGHIVLVNARAEELFGYHRDELIGKPVDLLLPAAFGPQSPWQESEAMGNARELLVRRKDGSEFPVEISLNPIRAPQGTLVLGSIVDISARKAAEEETRLLQEEITHVGRVSMMGQLASALAHEINQPLGAILRNAEAAELFLENETPDLEEIRVILSDIRTDDQRAGSVIDRMRALLKRHVLDTQLLDLNELVGNVAELIRPDAATRRVHFTVNVPPHLPAVRGDRVHLQQVLLNLIINGMDALTATQESRRVTVSAQADGGQTVEIAVSDTGHGIADGALTSVFDPFFTTKTDGMGMGLPISRTIVESHGGHLWVENNRDRGATFRFTLPVAAGHGAG